MESGNNLFNNIYIPIHKITVKVGITKQPVTFDNVETNAKSFLPPYNCQYIFLRKKEISKIKNRDNNTQNKYMHGKYKE